MAIKSTVELEVKSNVKGFKGELRQLTLEAQNAVKEFGAFSPQAVEAEKKVALLRDRIEDFNDRIKAVNPDKFAQVQTVVQGVARGFQAAQGAVALFGNQSKELEKTMIKLQGAMALADGLEGLGKIQQQFSAIAGNIKNNVVKAFSTLKGAIIATGLGALLVIVGLIIANFEQFKKVMENLFPGFDKMTKYIGGLVQGFTDWIGVTSAQDRALDKLNKTTEKSNEQLDREIALLQAQGDQIGVFFKQREKLNNQLAQARQNYGKNSEKEWGKIILDTKNALAILDIEQAKFEQEQIRKQAEADEQLRKQRKSQRQKRLDELKEEHEREVALILEFYGIKTKGIYKQAKLEEGWEKEKANNTIKLAENTYQKQYSNQEKLTLFLKVNHSELIQSAIGYFNTISELADAFATKDEASQRRAFEISKAMKYATTVLSTIEGTQNAFKTAQDSPITALVPIYPYVQAASAALFGLAQLAKIKKTKFNGASAPSQSSGAGVPQMGAPRTTSSTLQNGGNNLTNQTRVYVTESDISRTQNRVNDLQKVSVVK
jgi:hypothetical protein